MKVIKVSLALMLAALILYLLIVGQSILLPLVISLVFWYLINLLASAIHRVPVGRYLPVWSCYGLSIIAFILGIWAVVKLVSMNIDSVVSVAPSYQANFEARLEAILGYFRIEEAPTFSQLTELVNLRVILSNLASAVTSVAANGSIILLYIAFLLLEQSTFDRKISALLRDRPEKEADFRRLLERIKADVSKYFGIKVVTSTLTGVLSYIFLRLVGVDFAEFWAILIFMLNFIPTIGSIVATIFPSLITLVQFDSWTPFILVVTGVTSIQVIIGNFLEPRMMGNSLNLSPMVILLNLSLWGVIWGIPGMFLCVPILVISLAVFAHIPQTRGIAVFLSRDGDLSNLTEDELAHSG